MAKKMFNARSRKMTCVRNKSSSDKWRNDFVSWGTSENDLAFADTEIPKIWSYYIQINGMVLKSSRHC
jgi:hypothetical protein